MASKGIELLLTLVLMAMLCHLNAAQSGCNSALVGLAPCLNYVTGNSATPSPSCCSQLASVVQSQPQCLCQMLNGGGSSLGININQTQALSLPTACNVQTPPVSRCNANSPASSPLAPPSDSSNETPDGTNSPTSLPTIPSGTGSKTDATTQGTSDASIKTIKLHLTVFLVFIASHAFNTIEL